MASINDFTIDGRTPVSSFFLDESGAKHSAGGFFVIGMAKVRDVGSFLRGIRDVRDRHKFRTEMKFSEINRGSAHFYFDLIEYMAESPIRIGASVYDSIYGFEPNAPTWRVQAKMSAKLVVANTNRDGEAINVFLDLVQTPRGVSVSEVMRDMIRARLKSRCMVEAYDLDSKSTDGLQIADLVASAIAYERRHGQERSSHKAKVAARLRRAFNLDSFEDTREGKVNILTMRNSPSYQTRARSQRWPSQIK